MSQATPDIPDLGSGLHGLVPPLATPAQRRAAMDQAFDYRGDITLHTADGRVLEGYIFDRHSAGPEPYVRLIPKDGSPRVTVPYADITALVFSGRDPAAGKSWETWVAKYKDKKARGERADLEPEPLDE